MDRDTPGREQTLRFLAAPTDAGYLGSVSGGRVLEWIDKAGYASAVGWSGHYCVTAYVGNVHFTRPVAVGDLVEATARLVYTGRSSMHILVTVRSGSPRERGLEAAAECLMVFVAVDDDGRPTPVRQLPDGDEEDQAQKEASVRRIELRVADRRGHGRAVLHRREHRAAGHPAVPRRADRRQLGRQGARWHRHALGRRGGTRPRHPVVRRRGQHRRVRGGVRFYQPLRIGDLTEVEARLIYTGRHSMHVSVHVRSGNPAGHERRLTTHSLIVFVALSPNGTALDARPWEPTTEEDVHLFEHAQYLVALRAAVDDITPA